MNIFHIWCSLRDPAKELEFAEDTQAFLSYMHEREYIDGYRIARLKFEFSPPALGDFHIMVECKDLAQLSRAMDAVSAPDQDLEALRKPVYFAVKDLTTALYRDFPEFVPNQKTKKGEER
jgi:hypothetical protein